MDSNSIQESLFQTMKIFSDYAIENSKAAITIEGIIKTVINADNGEYEIAYTGNYFNAFTLSNKKYTVGQRVSVLIPDGDYSKKKLILGDADKQAGDSNIIKAVKNSDVYDTYTLLIS